MSSSNKDEQQQQIELVKPSSSLGLEIMLLVDFIASFILLTIDFILFVCKKCLFHYPYKYFLPDTIVKAVLFIINLFRIKLISIGNKTEKTLIILIGVLIGLLNLIFYLYYLFWQIYKTYYDYIFNGIGLAILLVEIILSLVAMFNIKAHEKTL